MSLAVTMESVTEQSGCKREMRFNAIEANDPDTRKCIGAMALLLIVTGYKSAFRSFGSSKMGLLDRPVVLNLESLLFVYKNTPKKVHLNN